MDRTWYELMTVFAREQAARVEEPSGAEEAFAELASGFGLACEARPESVVTTHYVIAGRVVRLRVVGQELARILELPLSHLRLGDPGPAVPELQIDLWDDRFLGAADDAPLGARLPPPESTIISPDSSFIVEAGARITLGLDRRVPRLLGRVRLAEGLSLFERGRPLLHVLMVWLMDQRVHTLHAGLVARDGRGFLLGGPSGSGKSSVALACALAGYDYLADDCVAIEPAGAGFVGHSLYCSAHVTPEHLQRFPLLAPHAIAGRLPCEDKHLVLLARCSSGRLGRTAPIAAVVLPQVVPSPGMRLRPATKREAILRLSPSTLCVLPGADQRRSVFKRLVDIVDAVPVYWLELNGPVEQIPAMIDRVP